MHWNISQSKSLSCQMVSTKILLDPQHFSVVLCVDIHTHFYSCDCRALVSCLIFFQNLGIFVQVLVAFRRKVCVERNNLRSNSLSDDNLAFNLLGHLLIEMSQNVVRSLNTYKQTMLLYSVEKCSTQVQIKIEEQMQCRVSDACF